MLHKYLRQVKFFRRRASFTGTKFGGGKARAGPEGETSFPYGVNKNSCFLLAPQQAEGFVMGAARAFSLAREARRQFRSK
jgi:hypothetical protein